MFTFRSLENITSRFAIKFASRNFHTSLYRFYAADDSVFNERFESNEESNKYKSYSDFNRERRFESRGSRGDRQFRNEDRGYPQGDRFERRERTYRDSYERKGRDYDRDERRGRSFDRNERESRFERGRNQKSEDTLIDDTYTKNFIEGKEVKAANLNLLEDPKIEISGIDPAAVKVFGEKKLVSDYENLLHPILQKTLKRAGIDIFSPIQRYTLPLALRKRSDLLGNAQTGSGKTIAFLLPLINDLLENKINNDRKPTARASPRAIIIAPTRELANQIDDEFKKYARGSKLLSQVIIGGTNISMCKRFLLENNPDVLVCTPGRMNALIDEYIISLGQVRTVVLDEADLMVDMGFMPQISHFFENSELPNVEERQTFLFSATMPSSVRNVIDQFMKENKMHIQVGVIGKPGDNIKQDFVSESDFLKKCEIIKDNLDKISGLGLVFTNTKQATLAVAIQLKNMGIASTIINGDMSQAARNSALSAFKEGRAQVLVATDIASRGLDIPMVDLVVNFELPQDSESFVHRIGRTGRAGREGTALTFVNASKDKDAIFDLLKTFREKDIEVHPVLKNEAELLRNTSRSTSRGNSYKSSSFRRGSSKFSRRY